MLCIFLSKINIKLLLNRFLNSFRFCLDLFFNVKYLVYRYLF